MVKSQEELGLEQRVNGTTPEIDPALWTLGTPSFVAKQGEPMGLKICLLYTSPSPRDATLSRMPSSA